MEFLKYIEGFGLIDGVGNKIDYVCIKPISTWLIKRGMGDP